MDSSILQLLEIGQVLQLEDGTLIQSDSKQLLSGEEESHDDTVQKGEYNLRE